jgi:hypothetical protein
MATRRMLVGLMALATLSALACGGDGGTEPADNYARAAGSYSLVSLNGQPLPALLFQEGSTRVDLLSATLVLRADRSFTESLTGRVTIGSGQPQPDVQVHNGTYVLSGATSSLTASFSVPATSQFPAFSFTGTLSGSVVTYTDETATYRYERR